MLYGPGSYESLSVRIDETLLRVEGSQQLPMLIASEKTKAVLERLDERQPVVVVCFGQIFYQDGDIRKKPDNTEQARRVLEGYSRSSVTIVLAAQSTHVPSGRLAQESFSCVIHWKVLHASHAITLFSDSTHANESRPVIPIYPNVMHTILLNLA